MAEQRNKRRQTQDRRGRQTANPAEIARRDLIAWCEQHQLPVPDEHRPQSSGR